MPDFFFEMRLRKIKKKESEEGRDVCLIDVGYIRLTLRKRSQLCD